MLAAGTAPLPSDTASRPYVWNHFGQQWLRRKVTCDTSPHGSEADPSWRRFSMGTCSKTKNNGHACGFQLCRPLSPLERTPRIPVAPPDVPSRNCPYVLRACSSGPVATLRASSALTDPSALYNELCDLLIPRTLLGRCLTPGST